MVKLVYFLAPERASGLKNFASDPLLGTLNVELAGPGLPEKWPLKRCVCVHTDCSDTFVQMLQWHFAE